ncbi:MauE/DoxX family redox-associated membrane protein [Flavitalea sp. BT771]|uniref:MauE/DoxX family redox-associated membrane protein n=1 Tax=Flavitalea sp. BT771 TaxID=3063329 RepID=UPI0034C6A79A
MKKKLFIDIVSGLCIILFLYTGMSKILDIHHFRWALSRSPLIGQYYAILGYTIPPIEVIISLLLLISFFKDAPRLQKWGLYGSAVLMSIFTVYITYMVELRTDRPCTCGGIISQMNWHQHMYFNTLFTILVFAAIWLNNRQQKEGHNNLSFT